MSNLLKPSSPNPNVSNDLLSDSMTRLATTASKQRKLIIAVAVILIAAALAASLYLTKRNAFRSQASEALFKARTTLGGEMKAVADAVKPPAVVKADLKKDAKKDAPTPVSPPANVDFAVFDVNAKLPAGIAALEKVASEYPGTVPGFDAKMDLGGLYFDHSTGVASFEKSAHWFETAASSATSSNQTIAALYNLGYAQEALGRCADAVKTFDRALNSGSGPTLGEIYRSKARCQETLGDKTGAKETYEKIVKTLPNTEFARFAETKKASL